MAILQDADGIVELWECDMCEEYYDTEEEANECADNNCYEDEIDQYYDD